MKFFWRFAAFGLAALAVQSAPATAQSSITGNWVTESRNAVVAIARCGNEMCGRITRVLVRTPDSNQRDVNNPDASLRNRPVEGLCILSGFRLDRGQYRHGEIYDPVAGRSYDARLRLNRDGSLRVTGCALGGLICQSQTWARR
jgi:uncharacterized protein (DUF2147 family)